MGQRSAVFLICESDTHRILPIGGISETIFANDNQIEVVYSTLDVYLLDSYWPESHIINESGEILFSQQQTNALILDNSTGIPLLISQINYGDFGQFTHESKIFSIATTAGNADFTANQTILFPNPASSVFEIKSTDRRLTSLEIIDLQGKIVDRVDHTEIHSYNNVKVSTGMYYIRLTDSEHKQSIHKILFNGN